jgi:hypothetical protein
VDEAHDQAPSEDDVRVDVSGRAELFGGEMDPKAGGVVEDFKEGRLGGEEATPGRRYLLGSS